MLTIDKLIESSNNLVDGLFLLELASDEDNKKLLDSLRIVAQGQNQLLRKINEQRPEEEPEVKSDENIIQ